jgi:hypothetical protein
MIFLPKLPCVVLFLSPLAFHFLQLFNMYSRLYMRERFGSQTTKAVRTCWEPNARAGERLAWGYLARMTKWE